MLGAELFSGERQWRDKNMMAVLHAVSLEKKHPPIPASVPPALAQLFDECMAFEPARRPRIAQVLERLRQQRDVIVTVPAKVDEKKGVHPWSFPAMMMACRWEPGTGQDAGIRFAELDPSVCRFVGACCLC